MPHALQREWKKKKFARGGGGDCWSPFASPPPPHPELMTGTPNGPTGEVGREEGVHKVPQHIWLTNVPHALIILCYVSRGFWVQKTLFRAAEQSLVFRLPSLQQPVMRTPFPRPPPPPPARLRRAGNPDFTFPYSCVPSQEPCSAPHVARSCQCPDCEFGMHLVLLPFPRL